MNISRLLIFLPFFTSNAYNIHDRLKLYLIFAQFKAGLIHEAKRNIVDCAQDVVQMMNSIWIMEEF